MSTARLLAAATALLIGSSVAFASDGAWDEGARPPAYGNGYPAYGYDAPCPADHVHGAGCGHFFYDGAWNLFPREHAHGAGCGHYLANGRWDYFPSAHHHSVECGHFFYDAMWHVFPPSHVHGEGCGHYFYDGCWSVDPQGHVHRSGCGHMFIDGEWRVGQLRVTPDRDPEVEIAQEPQLLEPRAPRPVAPPRPPEPPRDRLILPVSDDGPPRRISAGPADADGGTVYFGRPTTIVVMVGGTRQQHVHGVGCGHSYYSSTWNSCPPSYSHYTHVYPVYGPVYGHCYVEGRYVEGRYNNPQPLPPSEFYGRFRRDSRRNP